jgi:hypothetical protein
MSWEFLPISKITTRLTMKMMSTDQQCTTEAYAPPPPPTLFWPQGGTARPTPSPTNGESDYGFLRRYLQDTIINKEIDLFYVGTVGIKLKIKLECLATDPIRPKNPDPHSENTWDPDPHFLSRRPEC